MNPSRRIRNRYLVFLSDTGDVFCVIFTGNFAVVLPLVYPRYYVHSYTIHCSSIGLLITYTKSFGRKVIVTWIMSLFSESNE